MHARRDAICARYDDGLADLPLFRPAPAAPGDRRRAASLSGPRGSAVVRRHARHAAAAHAEGGVGTSVHFRAVHLHSYYRDRFGFQRGMFPNAETVSDQTLSLPLSPAMPDGDVDRVIEVLHECLR
jgi:dTDP-4-amino-4,6-dideoxygalactose transaminase